jgi:hypothetical protein
MKKKAQHRGKARQAKSILRLPDLEVAKAAVINSLSCPDAQRGYRHAIDEFVDWYCSESRLSFSKTVVVRYRIHLESRHLAPGTINLGLGAVRRLAYEAADTTTPHQRDADVAVVETVVEVGGGAGFAGMGAHGFGWRDG